MCRNFVTLCYINSRFCTHVRSFLIFLFVCLFVFLLDTFSFVSFKYIFFSYRLRKQSGNLDPKLYIARYPGFLHFLLNRRTFKFASSTITSSSFLLLLLLLLIPLLLLLLILLLHALHRANPHLLSP